jgi:hypothetical protein
MHHRPLQDDARFRERPNGRIRGDEDDGLRLLPSTGRVENVTEALMSDENRPTRPLPDDYRP